MALLKETKKCSSSKISTATNVISPNFEHFKVGGEVKFIEEAFVERPQAKRVSIGHHQLPS